MSSPDQTASILIVDDDEGLGILMAEALRAEGHEVETSLSGGAALQWLKSHTPDLMLLDLKLSDGDAPELLEKLQRAETRVPFIAVTGQGDERVAVDIMKRGALDYVMKDTAMLDLLPAVVKRALEALAREKALVAARAEQARLEQEVLAASERERHSIGADLHDGLGQLLTAVEFMNTALKEEAAQAAPTLAPRLDQMGGLLREAIAQTRFLARGLVPLGAGPDALQNGLTALADRTDSLARARCVFERGEPVEISNHEAAGHLYRIAQEAVNNAVKHSRAQHIVIRLRESAGTVRLEIEDDGAGLPPESEHQGSGLGLMRHRAQLIGARLAIDSRPGGGVHIVCEWPLSR